MSYTSIQIDRDIRNQTGETWEHLGTVVAAGWLAWGRRRASLWYTQRYAGGQMATL